MLNKNKKIIIVGVIVLILIGVVAIDIVLIAKKNKQNLDQLGEVRQAASFDDYVETDPGLMHKKTVESLQISAKEVTPPVPTQIQLEKITLTPIAVDGGDISYSAIGELPGNKFFRLEPENLNKIFSVRSPEEALKYVDFLMVTAGRSSYARSRQTVWQAGDYDKIGCKETPAGKNLALPTDRPISQAKVSGDGFEVDWVYFKPTVLAGYHKMLLQVGKDGSFIIKDDPDQPFWPCGEGFVF